MRQAHRFSGPGQAYEGLTKLGANGPLWTGEARAVPAMLDEPLRWKKPRRIFVNSMSDLFHKDVPDGFIDQVFGAMAVTRRHTYQVLTKRAERLAGYMCNPFRRLAIVAAAARWVGHRGADACGLTWPLPNVWLGVSAEDQEHWNERVEHLGRVPAAVRFVSVEPQLGPVDCGNAFDPPVEGSPYAPIGWVIVGGESGPGARPFALEWARSIVAQCKAAGVPVFVKQLGARPGEMRRCDTPACNCGGAHLMGLGLNDKKGGDPAEWPEDLRVREFPASTGSGAAEGGDGRSRAQGERPL